MASLARSRRCQTGVGPLGPDVVEGDLLQFGISLATANRRWQYALSVIAWRLNGRRVPAKRSRQYVVAVAEATHADSLSDMYGPLRFNSGNA